MINGACCIFLLIGFAATFGSPATPATVVLFPSPAYCTHFGVYRTIAVPIKNNNASSITAIVFGVLRNAQGQPLEISTATVSLNIGENATAYIVIDLGIGNYSSEIFVWSTWGASFSQIQFLMVSC